MNKLRYLLILSVMFFVVSPIISADSVSRLFNYTGEVCMNQSIEVIYARVSSSETNYWGFDQDMPAGWAVSEQNVNDFNQLRFWPGGTQTGTSISSKTFHFITPSVSGTYTFNGTYWNYGDNNLYSFNQETIVVGNCVGSSFVCADLDNDGRRDYDAVNCPIGRDRCIQTSFDFSNNTPILPGANIMNYSFQRVSNLTINTVGAEIKFRDMDAFNLDNNGCFTPLNLTDYVELSPGRAVIKSENLSQLNRSYTIVFKNISFSHPIIKRDGADCSSCNNIFFNQSSSEFIFGITGFASRDLSGFSFMSILSFLKGIMGSLTGNVIYSPSTSFITGNVVFEVVEQCSDGIQNYDETGVDCGGSCSACSSGGNNGGGGGRGGGGSPSNILNKTNNSAPPNVINDEFDTNERQEGAELEDEPSSEGFINNIMGKFKFDTNSVIFVVITLVIIIVLVAIIILIRLNFQRNQLHWPSIKFVSDKKAYINAQVKMANQSIANGDKQKATEIYKKLRKDYMKEILDNPSLYASLMNLYKRIE